MELETLLDKLRDVYNVTVSEMNDDVLETKINAVVRKISELYPMNEVSYVLSVDGTTRYAVVHDDLIRIKEVFYPRSISDSPFGSLIPQSAVLDAGSLSRNYEFIARMKLMNEVFPFEGKIVDHDHFDMLPTPTESGLKIYYEYLRYRTLAELPEMFEDELIEWVFFLTKDASFKKNSITAGDGYMFDRKGNVTVEKESVDGNKAHFELEKDIKAKIKAKVMKM